MYACMKCVRVCVDGAAATRAGQLFQPSDLLPFPSFANAFCLRGGARGAAGVGRGEAVLSLRYLYGRGRASGLRPGAGET